ncbi:MAG: hypothetical protein IJG37_02720 [Synergistaceae bacterium]|nr:hypothetical protein [Synergistaceae bacterium]MBQ6972515.1 hypothetical protein [Synergistaceae bacterium]
MTDERKPRFKRTTREEIRSMFTPEDFITDTKAPQDDEAGDFTLSDEEMARLSMMFSPGDFVTGAKEDE